MAVSVSVSLEMENKTMQFGHFFSGAFGPDANFTLQSHLLNWSRTKITKQGTCLKEKSFENNTKVTKPSVFYIGHMYKCRQKQTPGGSPAYSIKHGEA